MEPKECSYCDCHDAFADLTVHQKSVCLDCAVLAGYVVRKEGDAVWLDNVNWFTADAAELVTSGRISRIFGRPKGTTISGVCHLVGVEPGTRVLPDPEELAHRYRVAVNVMPIKGRRVIAVLEPDPELGRRIPEYIYADADDPNLVFAPFSGEISTPKEREAKT